MDDLEGVGRPVGDVSNKWAGAMDSCNTPGESIRELRGLEEAGQMKRRRPAQLVLSMFVCAGSERGRSAPSRVVLFDGCR
jgi:hypothetical protein